MKCKSYSHFYSKKNSVYAIFNDHCFNDALTNDIASFEQLGLAHKVPNKVPNFVRTAPCENVSSGIYGQRFLRSDCASAQSNQDLHYPLTDSCRAKALWHFAHAQDNLNPRILGMFEGTFSFDTAPS